MNKFVFCTVFCICVFNVSLLNAQEFNLFQWEYRVLVLSADEKSSQAQEQIAVLEDHFDAMEERELIVLRLTNRVLRKVDGLSPFPFQTKILENRQERRYLESIFSRDELVDGSLRVSLVGLDGQIKQVWDDVVRPTEVFEAIDAMPMRQRELDVQ
ncbi:MAG: DUF4174 domain-containing protein [Bdellovibrionales bacterium]